MSVRALLAGDLRQIVENFWNPSTFGSVSQFTVCFPKYFHIYAPLTTFSMAHGRVI